MTPPPPSNPEIRVALRDGFAALASGNYDQAAQVGSQLVARYPQESRVWHLSGVAELSRSNIKQATTLLEREHFHLPRVKLRIIWIMRAVVWPLDRATTH